MKETKIANRYAKALFDLALEQNVLDQIKEDMLLVAKVCEQNSDFGRMLQSPIIYTAKKEAILKEIFEKHIQQMTFFFLLIITRKNREAFIHGIALQFVILYKDFKNITDVKLSTAVKINEEVKNRIVSLLKEQTQGAIELTEKVKEDLIGGFVLNYDNKEYNASIKKLIESLRRDFNQNLFIREF